MCSLGHRYIVCDSFIETAVAKENKNRDAATSSTSGKPSLLLPGSKGALEVRSTGGEEGRGVYTTRRVKAFEKILVAKPYASLTIDGTCAHCCKSFSSSSATACACPTCGQQYCCEECALAAKPMHVASNECAILEKIGSLITPEGKESAPLKDGLGRDRRIGEDLLKDAKKAYKQISDRLDFVFLCLILGKAFAERYVLEGQDGDADLVLCGLMDDCFATGECPYISAPKNGEDTVHSVHVAQKDDLNVTFADVAQTTTNLNHFRGHELRRFRDMHAMYMQFQKVIPNLLPRVSEDCFVNLQCANMCNTFGYWDARSDALCGQGIFPVAAFQNHSCAPNVFHQCKPMGGQLTMYALRDIEEGEEIFMSYTEPRHGLTERRGHLKNSQHFICNCIRCVGEEKGQSTADVFDPETAMCHRCKSRAYMAPPNLASEGNLEAIPLVCMECGKAHS